MPAVTRYNERLRVVRYDDGAAKLAAIREALDPPEQPQGAPLCVRGSNYYLNHELGRDGSCARCGWEYPALTLNGRRG